MAAIPSMIIEQLPGNGSSSNGGTPRITRKRPRRPDTRQRNVKKAKRAKGEEYVSASGNVVPPRVTGPPCTCKRRCFSKFTDEQKEIIVESFNGLADKGLQDAYLHGLISARDVKRRRPRIRSEAMTRNRAVSFYYRVSM